MRISDVELKLMHENSEASTRHALAELMQRRVIDRVEQPIPLFAFIDGETLDHAYQRGFRDAWNVQRRFYTED